MVPYDRLRKGREIVFSGTRVVKSKGEEYTIHEFIDVETQAAFGLWGCALLDMQLTGIRAGSYMFMQYEGKEARKGGRTAHTFTVAVSGEAPAPVRNDGISEDDDALPF